MTEKVRRIDCDGPELLCETGKRGYQSQDEFSPSTANRMGS